jgi:hypothetical protein
MQDKFAKYVAAMLGAIGAQFVPAQEKVRSAWKWFYRPMSMEDHYVDSHGTLHRRDRKRDKSMSARQWKILKKTQHRKAKTDGKLVKEAS